MESQTPNEQFQTAQEHFMARRYDEALAILTRLEADFAGNHRILNARARCLDKLGRYEEALEICRTLLEVHGYEKIRPLYQHLTAQTAMGSNFLDEGGVDDWSVDDLGLDDVHEAPRTVPSEASEDPVPRRSIPYIRIVLLLVLAGAMYSGYLNPWIGGGLIGAYLLVGVVLRWAVLQLFSMPFRAKGKVLRDAKVLVHRVKSAPAPAPRDDDDGDDEESPGDGPLQYYWIELTITPGPAEGKFRHWEPGELALLPGGKRLKPMQYPDHSFSVREVRIIEDGRESPDEGGKYCGARRIKILAGLPAGERQFFFVYYFERFGELVLPI